MPGLQRKGSRAAGTASTRRGTGRALSGWGLVIGAAILGIVLAGPAPQEATADEDQIAQGAELFQRYCAVCHSSDAAGVAGIAPSVLEFSAAAVDLSMRTGRMPLADPLRGVRERTFLDEEREAVMAYLVERRGLVGEIPDPPEGDAVAGRDVYAIHCAQCHGASGKGGVAGDGVEIPPVVGLDPVTIASATREGPFAMPRFGPEIVSDAELGDIVAYLDEEVHQPTSPLGLSEVSKFEAVGFAALLTVAVGLVCAWAGGARRRRAPRGTGEATPEDG